MRGEGGIKSGKNILFVVRGQRGQHYILAITKYRRHFSFVEGQVKIAPGSTKKVHSAKLGHTDDKRDDNMHDDKDDDNDKDGNQTGPAQN